MLHVHTLRHTDQRYFLLAKIDITGRALLSLFHLQKLVTSRFGKATTRIVSRESFRGFGQGEERSEEAGFRDTPRRAGLFLADGGVRTTGCQTFRVRYTAVRAFTLRPREGEVCAGGWLRGTESVSRRVGRGRGPLPRRRWDRAALSSVSTQPRCSAEAAERRPTHASASRSRASRSRRGGHPACRSSGSSRASTHCPHDPVRGR